jgi:hypothetical protein
MLKIINSKTLAGYEDEFEQSVHDAAYELLLDCTDGNPNISFNEFEQASFDSDTHNKIKQIVYDLFEELGYTIESDGTSF